MKKKDLVSNKSIYVHMDSVINNVVTSGITFYNFIKAIVAQPENMLLLKYHFKDSSYNAHTAFHYLNHEDVSQLKEEPMKPCRDLCWVDFEDIDLLNQLSPQEVAELLYLAHTGRHLRSPFYYKLQNNFVYLTKEDGRYNKVYYRNMNHFYNMLASVIMKRTTDLINEKSLFSFTRYKKVSELPISLLKKIDPYFKEGVCIDFKSTEKTRAHFGIPIGSGLCDELQALEEREEDIPYSISKAHLIYDLKQNEWIYIEN